jgi:hypothetical protein
MEWIRCSGRGRIYSFVVNHFPISKNGHYTLAEQTESITAVVKLDEGPRILSDLIYNQSDFHEVRVNMVVKIVFEDVDSETTLLKFNIV